MPYITPFQSVTLFEQTFKHQINKETGKVGHRQFVFDKQFGDKPNELPVESDKYRLIWMPGCPHSNKAIITLRLLGLDRVISVGETGILRDPRGWVFSEDLGQVDPVLKIHYLDDAYLKGDPNFIGRSTVPAIIDIDTGKVVKIKHGIFHAILQLTGRSIIKKMRLIYILRICEMRLIIG